jgi:hypothetical protein
MIQTENAEDLMGELGDLLLEEDDVAESANDLRRWPINWGITSLVGTLGRRVETSSGTVLFARVTDGIVETGTGGRYLVSFADEWDDAWFDAEGSVVVVVDDGGTGVAHEVRITAYPIEDSNGGTGSGDTAIDHDGAAGVIVDGVAATTDCMRFLVGASGADDVEIVAFLKADYDAGLRATANRQGTTATGTDGRWVAPLMLDAGTYRILGNKDGYEVSSFEIVVP